MEPLNMRLEDAFPLLPLDILGFRGDLRGGNTLPQTTDSIKDVPQMLCSSPLCGKTGCGQTCYIAGWWFGTRIL